MAGVLAGVAVAEELATAGCGAVNAAYFATRAWRSRGARRIAATVLALLFAGTGLPAAPADSPTLAVVLGAPVLVAQVVTLALITLGARR